MAEDSFSCSENVKVSNKEFFESKSSTHNLLAKHRYTWTIHNFSAALYKENEAFASPTFSVGINENKSEWLLTLYPKVILANSKTNFGFFCLLKLLDCKMNEIQAEFKFCILNSNGGKANTLISNSGSRLFKKGDDHEVLTEERQLLINEKNEFLFYDQLSIVCEIMYKIGSKNNILEISSILRLPILPSTPAMDFTFLLQNKQLSDVTLSASGKEFPAHKVILSAGSSVFRAMFQSDMKESKNNRVEITDIDEELLGEMLRYLYTGKLNELEKMAPHLLGIAEKYDIKDLKIRCEESLLQSLSFENVVEFFILSDTFRATDLNNQVKKFIKDHFSVVVNRPEFETMNQTHPHLGIEACRIISCGVPSQAVDTIGLFGTPFLVLH